MKVMNKYNSYETERLILKPTTEEDAAFFLELYNCPSWIKYIGDRNIKTIEKARLFIKDKIMPQLEALGYSNYTIIRKTDHSKIGSCGLVDREGIDGIDIGFAFLPQYEKKGYAFEAAEKVKSIAIDEIGVKRLSAITTKKNIASQRLLEKLGLKYSSEIKFPDDKELYLLYILIL